MVHLGSEVNGAGVDFPGGSVKAVSQVAALTQIKTHHLVSGLHQSCVDCEVGGGSGKGLHVDAPLFRVKSVGFKGALLAQPLDHVDVLVAAVVAGARVTFSVLVGEGRTEGFEGRTVAEVLRCDQLDATELPGLFFLNYCV